MDKIDKNNKKLIIVLIFRNYLYRVTTKTLL